MAFGSKIRTWFNGTWHEGDIPPVMNAADHGTWLGTTVFDGARWFEGLAPPDLDAHCARVNRSASALMLTPTVTTEDMVDIVREGGLTGFSTDQAVYIRPMYWGGIDPDMSASAIAPPDPGTTGFAISLEAIGMADAKATTTLATTRFRRPVLESAVVNAKAGCLYPNNARMLVEARSKATPTPWPPTPWAMSPKAPPPMSSSCGMAKSLHRLPTAPSWRALPARATSPT